MKTEIMFGRVILRYFRSIENDAPSSHIHGKGFCSYHECVTWQGIQIRIQWGTWGLPLISLHVGHTFGRPLWIYTKKEWEELSNNYSNFLLNMVNKRLHYLNQISGCTISSLLEEPKIQLCWHWFCNLYIYIVYVYSQLN